jgi:phosphate transport system protein
MLRELLSIFRPDDPLKAMADNFSRMLRLAHELTRKCSDMYFARSRDPASRSWVYECDIKVNQLERQIRKQIITYMSLGGHTGSLPYCLALMSLVKDAERIGDYAKNLAEVVDYSPSPPPEDECLAELREVGGRVDTLFAESLNVVVERDRSHALELINGGRSLARRADALVVRIAGGPYDAATTTGLVMGTRFYKRIAAHLLNILSSVVVPLHKLDYFDEEGPTGDDEPTAGDEALES